MIGEPSRQYFWIFAREPRRPEEKPGELLGRAAQQGYDPQQVLRVPADDRRREMGSGGKWGQVRIRGASARVRATALAAKSNLTPIPDPNSRPQFPTPIPDPNSLYAPLISTQVAVKEVEPLAGGRHRAVVPAGGGEPVGRRLFHDCGRCPSFMPVGVKEVRYRRRAMEALNKSIADFSERSRQDAGCSPASRERGLSP
ncbi:MAG: lipocalin family protein [Gammaproteobacteria bacterium]|nr:lipocalin family protein [Gammaproteobacteria bacterium]